MAQTNPNLDPNTGKTNASELDGGQGGQQYIRTCTLLVETASGKILDLSDLRIKFQVKRSSSMTPNTADIRVYNLEEETAIQIRKEFKNVTLQAGYESNYGVIFQGNIKQVIIGRESATDTFIDIMAGDGDRAYNFAVVQQTLAKGSTQADQIKACSKAMADLGTGTGAIAPFPQTQLPRGKVMYGNAKTYLRNTVQSAGGQWSIQDEKITIIPNNGYAKGTRVVLTAETGLVGTPQQTNVGANIKALLNPNLRVNGLVVIDNKSLQQFKINLTIKITKENAKDLIPVPVSFDGTYFMLVVEHSGDTRGVEWYSNLTCLNIDLTSNPINAVPLSANGLPK